MCIIRQQIIKIKFSIYFHEHLFPIPYVIYPTDLFSLSHQIQVQIIN